MAKPTAVCQNFFVQITPWKVSYALPKSLGGYKLFFKDWHWNITYFDFHQKTKIFEGFEQDVFHSPTGPILLTVTEIVSEYPLICS